jgi:hypothetical protein
MKKPSLLLFVTPVALALSLVACDSKRENARENNLERKADSLEEKAGIVREEKEKVADAVERNDPGLNSATTEKTAEKVRKTGEQTADALENQADREREKK